MMRHCRISSSDEGPLTLKLHQPLCRLPKDTARKWDVMSKSVMHEPVADWKAAGLCSQR